MKEQQKRKFKQIHPEIEDGIDLRRCPHLRNLVGNEVDKMLVHMEEEELVSTGCLGVGVDVNVNVDADVDGVRTEYLRNEYL